MKKTSQIVAFIAIVVCAFTACKKERIQTLAPQKNQPPSSKQSTSKLNNVFLKNRDAEK